MRGLMTTGKQPHILNASSNLVGICLVLVTGLKLTGASDHTLADEISVGSAFAFIISCVTSYLSMRIAKRASFYETIADYLFLLGMFTLFIAVTAFAYDFF
jgi:hypothetical protein